MDIIHTSQIIITDKNRGNLYLEKWNRFSDIAFFGWKSIPWESPQECATRELLEETWILASNELVQIEQDETPVKFRQWNFSSTFFLLELQPDALQKILKERDNVIEKTLKALITDRKSIFMPMKSEFIRKVELALNHKN